LEGIKRKLKEKEKESGEGKKIAYVINMSR
jgi:hypothetical protein